MRRRMASSTAAMPWPVVAEEEQFDLRLELEEVLPHEARLDLVAAG